MFNLLLRKTIKNLTIVGSLVWTGYVSANSLESVFTCKVLTNSIVQVEQGKAESYRGLSGQFETGDFIELRLIYRDHGGNNDELHFNIEDLKRKKLIDNVYIEKNYLNNTPSFFMETSFSAHDSGGRYIRYRSNAISVNQDSQPHIVMNNYWKNDWNFIYTKTIWKPIISQTFSADCVLTKNNMSAISRRLLSWKR